MKQIVPLLNALKEVYSLSNRQGHSFSDKHGFVETSLPGVRFFWATEPVERTPLIYGTGIIIVGQGYKIGFLGDKVFRYDKDNYLVLSVPIPIECETHATTDNPLLGIFIDINISKLHELVALVKKHDLPKHLDTSSMPQGVEPVPLDLEMLTATERLLKCLLSPMDSEALGYSLISEITYRVLLGKHGPALYALTQQSTSYCKLASILVQIHQDYTLPLTVKVLAEEAGMSVSSFHRGFKQVTGESPLRYLKNIRLNKAKSLIVQDGISAQVAASRIGYESSSQFSREFKRYFGVPPSEAKNIKLPMPHKID